MDETALKMAMAGFFHDIGKLADKDVLGLSQSDMGTLSKIYLPVHDNHYFHSHAACTAAFIERVKDFLPEECNSPEWGGEDTLFDLASMHHNPKTPLQWIVSVADCVANGWDIGSFLKYNEKPSDNSSEKYLNPIFDQLKGLTEENVETEKMKMCYPLETFSPHSIFPVPINDDAPKTKDPFLGKYHLLYKSLFDNMSLLMHKTENKTLWFDHFESLMMHCSSLIPSANQIQNKADTPLYDHLKMVSALAVALYLYHNDKKTLDVEAIKNFEDKKILVINGDFQGIQKYIFEGYSPAKKYRSKILRGKSFTVSLFSELAADLLCHEIGLPATSVVLNAAGRFAVLAPNTKHTVAVVQTIEKTINDWLVKISCGETLLSLSSIEASCNDFLPGKFHVLWDKLDRVQEEKKYQTLDLNMHGGVAHDFINKDINGKIKICPVCAKRQAGITSAYYTEEDKLLCSTCRDHIFWGTNLVKFRHENDIKENVLFEPIFKRYQMELSNGHLIVKLDGVVRKYWDLNNEKRPDTEKKASIKYFNLYVPMHEKHEKNDGSNDEAYRKGDPKTLNHIASQALNYDKARDKYTGIEALGVLKADVDDMGLLMFAGIDPQRFSLPRLATLSRQLNQFFVVCLPDLIRTRPEFADIYTVFAGGDDLFLIGPWNRVIEFAGVLSDKFNRYVCGNKNIHLSAGISFHKDHTPVDAMARSASTELEKSKQKDKKNSLSLFSETIKWRQLPALNIIKNQILEMMDSGALNNAMLYRLNTFLEMAEQENSLVNRKHEIHINDMACTKWRFMLAYSIERNVAKALKGKMEKEEIAKEIIKTRDLMVKWLDYYKGKLKIPLWDILYNNREEKGHEKNRILAK